LFIFFPSLLFFLSCLSLSSSLLAYLLCAYMPTWGYIRALFHYLLISNLCSCFRCFVTFLFLVCIPITLVFVCFEFAFPHEFDISDKLKFSYWTLLLSLCSCYFIMSLFQVHVHVLLLACFKLPFTCCFVACFFEFVCSNTCFCSHSFVTCLY
jgi:hypothetical protein